MNIRPKTADDEDWVSNLLIEHWGGTMVVAHGQRFEAERLPALVAGQRDGLATYQISDDGREAELVTLDAVVPGRGVGTALVAGLVQLLRGRGVTILRLTTTNDNLTALRFYQRRGFQIVGLHPGAMVAARRLKSTIPELGEYGIPIRDEIELELVLSGEGGGQEGDDDHDDCSRPMMPSDAQDDRPNRPRSLWRRAAQSFFAVLCVVAASLAGGASVGNSPLQAAAADKTTSADPSRGYGCDLQRANGEFAAERIARRGIEGGSVPDSGSGVALPARQDFVWLPDGEIGVLPSNEYRPDWLTVRAGFSRAPPTVIGRSRPFA
jgi:GNAT superfamily N-acetyltransferase